MLPIRLAQQLRSEFEMADQLSEGVRDMSGTLYYELLEDVTGAGWTRGSVGDLWAGG